jgi:hypothetical protein
MLQRSFISYFVYLVSVISLATAFTFFPNQLAANVWYQPSGRLINGHIDESFSDLDLWSNLSMYIRNNKGDIIIQAAEIGYMAKSTLDLYRSRGIAVTIALPGFTQCFDGADIAKMGLYGETVGGKNLFCEIFRICNPVGRTDPLHVGWFTTIDGQEYTPDLLNFDERMPNLVPYLNYDQLINTSAHPATWKYPELSWNERKNRSRFDICPSAGPQRIPNLMQDYIN